MKDFRISFGFCQHPKTIKLIREFGYEGPFRLLQLWCFVAQNMPDGFLGGEDDEEEYFEIAAGWSGAPKHFIQGLIKIGFIDRVENGLQIHGWEKHNPFVAGFEERSRQAKINQSKRDYGNRNSIGANASGNANGITDGNAPSPPPPPFPSPPPPPFPELSSSKDEGRSYRSKKGKVLKGKALDSFEQFWEAFGYRQGKAEAADSWLDMKNPPFEKIIEAAKREAKRRPGLVASKQTPKMAQGWLSARRREDDTRATIASTEPKRETAAAIAARTRSAQ